jgi:hypothetical protein
MDDRNSLQQLQSWLQTAITGQIFDAQPKEIKPVSEVLSTSTPVPSNLGLSIYQHGYVARLVECLQKEFPIFRRTVGEEVFTQFAVEYLGNYPPESYTLADLGKQFPEYLQASAPRESWADFIIDLATLERAFSEVFDAPESESSQVLKLKYPAHTYFLALRNNPELTLELPGAHPTKILINREDFIVKIQEV